MLKLKKLIRQLDAGMFSILETSLIKTRGENFLFLLQSYRNDTLYDEQIALSLKLNQNAFYVLKSRLHDKIQEVLAGDVYVSKEDIVRQLERIPEMCYSQHREIAMAFLHKLERDLLCYDMHNELLLVYSALKKLNLYSSKYFHYTNLYNKHIAFSLSVEKSEDILGQFNITLSQYNFSKTRHLLEKLLFLRKGIDDHFALNPSRQVELIRNIIEIQLAVFCAEAHPERTTEEALHACIRILSELPPASPLKAWQIPVDYLCFEYYQRTGNVARAKNYFQVCEENLERLLLFNHVCLVSEYIVSRIVYAQTFANGLEDLHLPEMMSDSGDFHSEVQLKIGASVTACFKNDHRAAVALLNELLNEKSFKDYLHVFIEIRLLLGYYYLEMKEYDMALNVFKNLQRKINSEKEHGYENVLHLVKLFYSEIKNPAGRNAKKQSDQFLLFSVKNNHPKRVMAIMMPLLKRKYEN